MLEKILNFGRRPFIRNVVAVASGAVASQGVVMIFSPIVTRIYGPEIYGIQGVFMSISGVLGSIAALTYPVAIVLPRSDVDALGLARLSVYVGALMSLLIAIALYLFGADVLSILKAEKISDLIYLIPFFTFFSALSMVFVQWLIRKKEFALTAKISVFHAFVINLLKVGFGTISPTASVLIVTTTFGVLLNSIMIFFGMQKKLACDKNNRAPTSKNLSIWELAKQHSDFPLLRSPQILLNSISSSLPVIILSAHFGPASAGFFSIAIAVLGMPTAVIGSSVMQVFYPRINEAIHNKENVKSLIVHATWGLAVMGFLPFVLIAFVGPKLFGFVFGSEWEIAGNYAQWLSLWIFFQYINKPAVAAIPALGLQRGLLIYEVFSSGTKVLALYIGYTVFNDEVIAIALFSIFGVIAYAWLISWVVFHSGKVCIIK